MSPLQLATSLLESRNLFESYDYANTDIKLPPEVSDFLLDWNKLNIPEDVLFKEDDDGKGRELDPHITVKYGLLTKDVPPELKEVAKTTKPFPVLLGKISLFTTNPKFDVVKLDVESKELHRLNRRVADAVPHEDTYPTYRPHATLAYVEKGSCDHMVGDDVFKDQDDLREFTAYGMHFSGPGDAGDETRTKESLLFSQSSPTEPVEEEKMLREDVSAMTRDLHEQAAAARCRQEMVAAASSVVESWHRSGLTTEQMMRRLRSGNWDHGMKYWLSRKEFPQTFTRFTEQVEEYIERVREAKFSETASGLDPFGQCAFPADPDRTKLFLRYGSKRRGERSIL